MTINVERVHEDSESIARSIEDAIEQVQEAADAAYATILPAYHTVASSGSALTLDPALGSMWDVTWSAICALSFASGSVGQTIMLRGRQGGTVYLPTIATSTAWAQGGATPTWTSTANAVDDITFVRWADGWSIYVAAYDIRTV